MGQVREELELTQKSQGSMYSVFINKMCNDEVTMHCHKHFEVIMIRYGRAVVKLEDRNIEMKAENILYIAPYQRHRVVSLEESEFIVLQFSPSMLGRKYENILNVPYFLELMIRESEIEQLVDENQEISKLLRESILLQTDSDWGYELGIKGNVYHLIYQFIQLKWIDLNTVEQLLENQSDKIWKILQFVESNIGKEIKEDEIAKRLGYNTNYFSQLFKKCMKVNFSTYILHFRVCEAEKLLIDTRKSVTEIGLELGFNSLSYFNRAFKKKNGVSPRDYRKKYKV